MDWRRSILWMSAWTGFPVSTVAGRYAWEHFGFIAGACVQIGLVIVAVVAFDWLLNRWYVQRGMVTITIDDGDGKPQTWFKDLGPNVAGPMQRGDQ